MCIVFQWLFLATLSQNFLGSYIHVAILASLALTKQTNQFFWRRRTVGEALLAWKW